MKKDSHFLIPRFNEMETQDVQATDSISLAASILTVISATNTTLKLLRRAWSFQNQQQYLEDATQRVFDLNNTLNIVYKTVSDIDNHLDSDIKDQLAILLHGAEVTKFP